MNLNPFEILRNANALQEKVRTIQNELANVIVEGAAGGGLVKISMNGHFKIISITLSPIAVDNRDIPMLQDLIKAAHTEAVEKLYLEIQSKLGPLAQGLSI